MQCLQWVESGRQFGRKADIVRVSSMAPQRLLWPCIAATGLLSTMVDNRTSVNYRRQRLIEVRQTTRFSTWLAGLRDLQAQVRILKRIDRAAKGNLGDVSPVGQGVSEMRVHYGPGYRVYFVQRGAELIVLLCGGVKNKQSA